MDVSDVSLHPEDEAALKCLRDHLSEYIEGESNVEAEIARVRDSFILDQIRTNLTIERVKNRR